MKNEFYNKLSKLFPELTNIDIKTVHQSQQADPDQHTDGNGNILPAEKINMGPWDTMALFSTLSKKWLDGREIDTGVIDPSVINGVEQINVGAGCPVINYEVDLVSSAKMDGHNFNNGTIQTNICQVRLHRFHSDFKLYDTDILYGYGIENKAKSAMNSVLTKIQQYYVEELLGVNDKAGVSVVDGPISVGNVAKLSGLVATPYRCYMTPPAYAKLLQSSLGVIDITQPGALGFEEIVRVIGCDEQFRTARVDSVALSKGNIIGVAGAQSFDAIAAYAGNAVAVRDMGTISNIPFNAIFSFDPATMAIRCSVQAWVGFATPVSNSRLGIKDNNTEPSVKVEVVNTTAKPVNTKAVTA